MEYRNGNTFATLAFGSFGFFWHSFVILLILPKLNLAAAPDSASLAAYLIYVEYFHRSNVYSNN
ncbi:MAG: acetate uptake transporter [Methanobacterium sp.]